MACYRRNPNCTCERCRYSVPTGAVVLITLGVLFLVGEFTPYSFDQTSPVFLIVLGLLLFLRSRTSLAGHIPPGYALYGAVTPYGGPPVSPPPVAGGFSSGSTSGNPASLEVHHG